MNRNNPLRQNLWGLLFYYLTLIEYIKTITNNSNKLYSANDALIALAKNNITVVPIGTEIVITVLKILYIDVCSSSGTDCKINASSFGLDIPAK